MSETKKRINFILRFNPYLSSINGRLLAFLREHKRAGYSTRERILKSLSAYWSPFAAKWAGEDEEEVKSLALSSINQLELQIQYIRDSFDLPQPQLGCLARQSSSNVVLESMARTEKLVPPQVEIESEEMEVGALQSKKINDSVSDEKFLSLF